MAIEVDALALKADQRFQELSQEIDNLPESDFEKDWKSHITASGGTTDPKEIKKHKSKTQAKEKKISTYEQTIELIREGKSLHEISDQRGMALTTIQGHILKISDTYPDINIELYKPDEVLMDRIKKIYSESDNGNEENYSPDGRIKSSIIFKELGGKIDYGTIKLAYAYLDI